jgi:hypothetical protein
MVSVRSAMSHSEIGGDKRIYQHLSKLTFPDSGLNAAMVSLARLQKLRPASQTI